MFKDSSYNDKMAKSLDVFSKELLKPINFNKEKKDDDLKRVNMNIDMKDLDQELKEPNLKEKFFFMYSIF